MNRFDLLLVNRCTTDGTRTRRVTPDVPDDVLYTRDLEK